MPQVFHIVLGGVFTVAVMLASGKLLLRGLSVRLHRGEEELLAFIAGAPLVSTAVFLLCAAGVARKGVFLICGAALLVFAWKRGTHRPSPESLAPLDLFWRRFFLAFFAIFTAVYLANAMAPEISPDGSAYHLGLVARYVREHGFHPITTNMYANLSQGVEMLFVVAFSIGRHSAAALVHFAFLVVLPLLIVCYGRRTGFPAAGVCAALFVYLSPVVGIDGISAYIDVAVACIAFALFYLLQVWAGERDPGLIVPIGLVAGFGYASKYTALLGVPYALGLLLWKQRRKRAALLRPVLAAGICAGAVMLPWMAKNWIWLGNPFSPFLNAVFPNPYVTVGFEREYGRMMRIYDLHSRWEIPLQVTVKGELSGQLGPLFVLAPLALLALRRPAGRQVLLAALVFGLPYLGNIGTRFLIPPLPFLALAMAMEFTAVPHVAPVLVAVHALLSWPTVIPRYGRPSSWHLRKVPWREALRIKPEEPYLAANLKGYPAARLIERIVPREGQVLTFTPVPEAYTTRQILVAYQSASNHIAGDILWAPLLRDRMPTWRQQFRFPQQKLRRIRVVQTAAAGKHYWSVGELRIYGDGFELPRGASWKLRASPNPWYVQLAFDNSPVTRWSSEQSLYSGMFVEVDFGRDEAVDGVTVDCAHDQYGIRLKLEGQDGSGNWKPLGDKPQISDTAPMLRMRRAAAQELKHRGIEYILVFDTDYFADDYRQKLDAWGMAKVGEAGGATLYRIL